ncbi:MAG: hypothetical protein IPK60_07210 [Sandaracinaceae bacterium]|nr:hypothetical protein [Sandaracinaceae bacterium]
MRKGFVLGALLMHDPDLAQVMSALATGGRAALEATLLASKDARAAWARETAALLKGRVDGNRADDPRVFPWIEGEVPRNAILNRPTTPMRRGFTADEGVRRTLRALVGEK